MSDLIAAAEGVEEIEGELSGNETRDGRDDGKCFLLFQHRDGIFGDVLFVSGSFCFSCKVQFQPRYQSVELQTVCVGPIIRLSHSKKFGINRDISRRFRLTSL